MPPVDVGMATARRTCRSWGTAAVISPVGELCWQDKTMLINGGNIGTISQKLYDELTAIQLGKKEDRFGWVEML